MTTNPLKIKTVSNKAFEWLQNKYKAADSSTHDVYARFLADDCELPYLPVAGYSFISVTFIITISHV